MPYLSTRGEAPKLGFSDALLAGLARDGGLYVPEVMPTMETAAIGALAGLPYAQAATKLMLPFVDGALSESELAAWSAQTSGEFKLTMLSGNHFFLHDKTERLVTEIARSLERIGVPSENQLG